MPHEHMPTPPALDEETIAAVRDALGRVAQEGDGADGLSPVLKLLASEAHRKGMPPEQVLVALKSIWVSLPEVRRAPRTGPHDQLLQRVISTCIEEYYSI